MHGLKDDEIAQLVNAIRDELRAHITSLRYVGFLREVVSQAVVAYLASQNLRIDHQEEPNT